MKKLLFTLLIGITSLAYSQAPQKISYQGVARNVSGTVLANQPIGIRFDIHQGSASGTIVFTETHTGISTNGFGLFTTYIGSINNLSVINWATNSYFIEVSIDPNTGTFSSLGSQQLMSVPYALNAGSAPAPTVSFTNNILSVGGNTTTIPAGTNYTGGTGINVAGSTITNTAPDQTITITPAGSATVTGTYPNFIISTPIVQTYTAGNGIDITGGVISNTTAAVTPTITGTGATTVTGTYPNLTINTPTVAPDQTVSITGINSATVTGAYPNFTVNVPNGSSLPNALSGQFLYNTGTVWDTLPRTNLYFDGTNFGIGTTSPQANFHVVGAGRFDASVSTPQIFTDNIKITGGTAGQVLTSDALGNGTWQMPAAPANPTITSTGIAVVTPTTGNTFNVNVPVPSLSYNNVTNLLTLTQGSASTTASLTGTGASTISMTGAGIANVSPTTGSAFTVTVPSPTYTANGPTTITGSYPNYTINSVVSPSTTLIQGNNVTLNQSGSTYTVSSTTPTITGTGATTVSGTYPTLTINTPTSQVYTAGSGISISSGVISNTAAAVTPTITGTGVATVNNASPNYTVNVPMSSYNNTTGVFTTGTQTIAVTPTLTLVGNVLRSGPATNTVNIPAPILSYTGSATAGTLQSGAQTVTIPNYTLSNSSNTITLNNGTATSTAIIPVPTLTLNGSVLQSGPATNTVDLTGFGGIYSGSGSIPTGSTTVTVGTNTLTFLSGNIANKPIANFYGGGITGTSMNLGHIGNNSATLKFIGSATTTPVNYGYVTGSTNGISISGGASANGLYATNNAEVGIGTYTTGTGKFVITHTASQADPTMHLRETTGGLNRIKYSNNTVASKYFETAAQTNAVDANGAYSINYFDGTIYKPVLLVTGERKVNINNLNTVLGSLHVMENATTAGNGIISEGFAQAAQINLARNNQPALAARLAVVSGDELGKINFAGYDGSTFGDGAKIYAKASENVTGSNKGTELIFSAVPTGTNIIKEVFKINGANKLEVLTSLFIPFNSGTGKVLTSDAAGNASWQTFGGSSPWIQGAGTITQNNIGDLVGIGPVAPTSQLHVSGTSDPLQITVENGGGNFTTGYHIKTALNEWFMGQDGSSADGFRITDRDALAVRLQIDQIGRVGIGTTFASEILDVAGNIKLDSTLMVKGINSMPSNATLGNGRIYFDQPSGKFKVSENGGAYIDLISVIGASPWQQGAGIITQTNLGDKVGIGTNTPNAALEINHNVSGIPGIIVNSGSAATTDGIGSVQMGSGSAGVFSISNATNTSNALQANNNGSGSAISGFNSGSGNAGYFLVNNASSNGTGIQVTTTGTGNALNANANSGTAINAVSTGAAATELIFNNGSGDGLQIFSTTGRGINATNTSNIVPAAQFYNDGTSNSLLATKNTTTTAGNVARFENNSTSNAADAMFVKNLGTGAAIHALSGPTVAGSSNVALWLEAGHIKTTGTTPAITTTLTTLQTYTVIGNDIAGKLSALTSTLTAVPAGQDVLQITFSKPYPAGSSPVVILTNTSPNSFAVQAFVTGVTNTGFKVRFNNASALNTSYSFNYLVIE